MMMRSAIYAFRPSLVANLKPWRGVLIATSCLLAGACTVGRSLPEYSIAGNESDDVVLSAQSDPDNNFGADGDSETGSQQRRPRASRIPSLGVDAADSEGQSDAQTPALGPGEIDTVVPPLALPAFIDVVFGEILSVPYTTGPGVAARSEIVQLRSSGAMPADVFLSLVTSTLKDYGVQVAAQDGVYQILENTALKARIPRFVRSRARAETPAGLRPIVQYVELNAIDAATMASILNQALGRNNQNLTVNADSNGNYVILNGLPEDVNAALSIIYDMDELQFAGTQVQRISPRYWEATDLSAELQNILSAEGWQVSLQARSPMPILLLAVERSNDLLVFTREEKARVRINYWIRELDRPAQSGDTPQVFVYSVKNMDANVLAITVNQVISGIDQQSLPPQIAAARAAAATAGSASGEAGGRGAPVGGLVVDPLGNRLIFSGTASEYEQMLPLLRQLDVPPAEVLIEVMIAQVQLTDSTELGVDWTIRNLNDDALNNRFAAGSDDSSGLSGIVSNGSFGPAGVAFGVLSPDVEVAIDAFAQNNMVNVLSTPRLLARSGAAASVQVGTEVPILSTQATATTGDAGTIIQQVQYRSTGIILAIEPIVFSNNRIDLNISQEISSTLPGTGPVPSPSFNNTSVTTLLSLEDGGTAVIGGLIQDNVSRDKSGVPFLKDIPGLGTLFSTTSTSVDRTELVILIKAYVVRGQSDRSAFANKYKSEIDQTLRENDLTTLRPRDF
ncbi:MAG: secretin N-terminal domain-containing protein [Pseudomonadota bacterium]